MSDCRQTNLRSWGEQFWVGSCGTHILVIVLAACINAIAYTSSKGCISKWDNSKICCDTVRTNGLVVWYLLAWSHLWHDTPHQWRSGQVRSGLQANRRAHFSGAGAKNKRFTVRRSNPSVPFQIISHANTCDSQHKATADTNVWENGEQQQCTQIFGWHMFLNFGRRSSDNWN